MDLHVFTHRSSKLTKSLKRLEDNSLILLLCNHLLEKEKKGEIIYHFNQINAFLKTGLTETFYASPIHRNYK